MEGAGRMKKHKLPKPRTLRLMAASCGQAARDAQTMANGINIYAGDRTSKEYVDMYRALLRVRDQQEDSSKILLRILERVV